MKYPSFWVEIDCKLIQRTINKSYLSLDEFTFHLMRLSHRQRSLIYMLYLCAEYTEEVEGTDYHKAFNEIFDQYTFYFPDELIVRISRNQDNIGKMLTKAVRMFQITKDMKKLRIMIQDD